MAALRTWRPDLTPDQADRLLNETAAATPSGRRLDLTSTFIAAGLGPVTAIPTPTPTATPTPASPPPAKRRLARPRVAVKSTGRGAKRTLTVKAKNRPRGARLTVRVFLRKGKHLRRVASRTRATATVRIRVRSWTRVTARFSDPTGQYLASRTRIVTRR
jgi:hypothetical protein